MKLLNALDAFDELVDFGKLIVAAPFMITAMGTAIIGAVLADALRVAFSAPEAIKEKIDVIVDKLDDKTQAWITRKNAEKQKNLKPSIEDNTALLHTPSEFDKELDKLEQASFVRIGLGFQQ